MLRSRMAKAVMVAWLACVGAAPLTAQPADDAGDIEAQRRAQADQQRAQAEQRGVQERRRQAEQQRTQAEQQTVVLERELENARRELAEAAREVARLSAQVAGPTVGEITRRFRYAGQRAMLGLNIEDTELGVRVAGVSPNGPAASAGLAVGDTIVAIEGADLAGGGDRSPSELLLAQMTNVEPGESVELRVLREGDYRDVEVQARPIEPGQFFDWAGAGNAFSFSGPKTWRGMFQPRPWSDLDLVALTPALGAYFGTDKGLLVVRAPRDTTLGLKDGDVILEIGGREPQTPEHAVRILASFEPGETLHLTIMRNQRRETLEVRIRTE